MMLVKGGLTVLMNLESGILSIIGILNDIRFKSLWFYLHYWHFNNSIEKDWLQVRINKIIGSSIFICFK